MTSPDDKLTLTRKQLEDAVEFYVGSRQPLIDHLAAYATIDPAPREPQVGDVWRARGNGKLHWITSSDTDPCGFGTVGNEWIGARALKTGYIYVTNTDSLTEFLKICEGDHSVEPNKKVQR